MKAGPLLLASVGLAGAAEPPPDKRQYSLFDPVPVELLRELSTDRPDMTESPWTVDAGHFQVEVDLFAWSHAGATDAVNILSVNAKVGLTHSTDLQLLFEGWGRERTSGRGAKLTREGFGDATVRLKHNLWGNDGGPTALAIMPYVTVPLGAGDLGRDEPEAGVIIPFGWNLPGDLYLGLMTEWDWIGDGAGGHRHAWLNTVTLGFPVTERVGGFVEFAGAVFTDGAPWEGSVNGGLTWAPTDSLQFDIGCNVGVSRAAPDVVPFVGVTFRH